MKITKTQLKQIIKEELAQVIDGQDLNEIFGAMRNLARSVVPGGLEGGDQAYIDKAHDAARSLYHGKNLELADKIIVGDPRSRQIKRSPKAEQMGIYLVTDMTPEDKIKMFKGLSFAEVEMLVLALDWRRPTSPAPVNRVIKSEGKDSVNILVNAVEGLIDNLNRYHDYPMEKFKPSIEHMHPNIKGAYGAGDKFAPNS